MGCNYLHVPQIPASWICCKISNIQSSDVLATGKTITFSKHSLQAPWSIDKYLIAKYFAEVHRLNLIMKLHFYRVFVSQPYNSVSWVAKSKQTFRTMQYSICQILLIEGLEHTTSPFKLNVLSGRLAESLECGTMQAIEIAWIADDCFTNCVFWFNCFLVIFLWLCYVTTRFPLKYVTR